MKIKGWVKWGMGCFKEKHLYITASKRKRGETNAYRREKKPKNQIPFWAVDDADKSEARENTLGGDKGLEGWGEDESRREHHDREERNLRLWEPGKGSDPQPRRRKNRGQGALRVRRLVWQIASRVKRSSLRALQEKRCVLYPEND